MLSIQHIYFADHQSFDDFEFKNSDYFVLTVYLTLGDEKGNSLFYFDVTNDYYPGSDHIIIKDYEVYFRKKAEFVMKDFDKYILLNFINALIKENSIDKNENEISNSLSKYFHWEFDNYIPQ